MAEQRIQRVQRISFFDQIARNKRNSFLLLFFIFIVLIALGYIVARIFSGYFFVILALFSVFAIFYIWLSYYFSAQIALAAVGAKEADPVKYRQLHNLVEGLAIAAGLPKPKVYVMQSSMINAFATGRDEKHAVVCVTTGALEKLNREELEGVLAHELSHIKNYDIRFVTLVAVAVGMISIISQMFLRSMWIRGEDREGKGNAVLLVIGIVLAIIAPIVVKLVQLAISRKREFMADAGSVQLTRNPQELIAALKKIKADKPQKVPEAVAPMFFSDPLGKRIIALFQTHPPIDLRIKVLEAM